MNAQKLHPSGAWQVSAMVSNGRDNWIEVRTFYGTNEKESVARFINTVLALGWTVTE